MSLNVKNKKQPWFEFSRGEYYLKTNSAITQNHCTAYSGGIDAKVYNSSRGNKIELVTYADTAGIEPCPGVVWEEIINDTTAVAQISAGLNVAREVSLMRKGFMFMVYAKGTIYPYYGMIIAPHPSGFQEWKPGMFKLGKFASETMEDGVDFTADEYERKFRVEVDVGEIGEPTRTVQQLTVSSHTAALSGVPLYFESVYATAETGTGHFKILDLTPTMLPGVGEYDFYQTRRATCQAGGTTTTVVLDASASATDDFYNGMTIEVYNSTVYEMSVITDYVGATKTATISPALSFSPGATHYFHIIDVGEAYTILFNVADAVTAARVVYRE